MVDTRSISRSKSRSISRSKSRSAVKTRKIYSKAHYESKDGMLTYVWGPPLWHFLHTMSFNYPVAPTQRQKTQYRRFMKSLQGILPCGKCRDNLRKNYEQLPLLQRDMKSRDTFSKYVYELHEVVNRMLKKTSGLSYAQVRERYEHFRARCRRDPSNPDTKAVIHGKEKGKENGCVEPVSGVKSKCVMRIVPLDDACETLQVDDRCKCTTAKSRSV